MITFKRAQNFLIFALALIASLAVGAYVAPTWTVEEIALDAHQDGDGRLYYIYRGKPVYLEDVVLLQDARLNPDRVRASDQAPEITEEFVYTDTALRAEVLPAVGQTPLAHLVVASRRCRGAALLAHAGARHVASGWDCGRGVHSGPVRHHGRRPDPFTGHDRGGGHPRALPVVPGRFDGHLVAHRSRSGLCRADDPACGPGSQDRQAGCLVPGHYLLSGRHRQYRSRGHDGQAHCRQGKGQPRGAGLHRRFYGLADRIPAGIQCLAGICAGLYFRVRRLLSGHRSRSDPLLLQERAVLLLRHFRRVGHIPVEHRKAPFSGSRVESRDAPVAHHGCPRPRRRRTPERPRASGQQRAGRIPASRTGIFHPARTSHRHGHRHLYHERALPMCSGPSAWPFFPQQVWPWPRGCP